MERLEPRFVMSCSPLLAFGESVIGASGATCWVGAEVIVDPADPTSLGPRAHHPLWTLDRTGPGVPLLDGARATVVVTTTDDRLDGDVSSIDALYADPGLDGFVSLREAILAANNTPNGSAADRILFSFSNDDAGRVYYRNDRLSGSLSSVVSAGNADDSSINDFDPDYPGGGFTWYRIRTNAPLPAIVDDLIIDGFSQRGSVEGPASDVRRLRVEIDGSLAGSANGLSFIGADGAVRGLAVNSFDGHGIVANAGGSVTLEGSFIGTDVTGTAARGNSGFGIFLSVDVASSRIGGDGIDLQNVISANTLGGIRVDGRGVTIEGNLIGLRSDGSGALGNAGAGVVINGDGNVLGGSGVGRGNVIAGNVNGVVVGGRDNSISSNFIGTDVAGAIDVPNVANGVVLVSGAAGNAVDGNLVSGNAMHGVVLQSGADDNRLRGNLIGPDVTGINSLGNGGHGVYVLGDANEIGGTSLTDGNVISGNIESGVVISGDRNILRGNLIGVDVSASFELGNSADGIAIVGSAMENIVGGETPAAANVISGNAVGVRVSGGDGNAVLGNAIFGNREDAIRLGSGGTANDARDLDAGPNGLQNRPVLLDAAQTGAGGVMIDGRLSSAPSTSYRIEFFASSGGDAERYLGFINVATDSEGDSVYRAVFATSVQAGERIVATATGLDGTSELSADVAAEVVDTVPPFEVANTGATVLEGGRLVLSPAMLRFDDARESHATVWFAVTGALSHGHFESTLSPGVPIAAFTQQDVDAGRVVYVHAGGEGPEERVVFDVSDGGGGAGGGAVASGQVFTIDVTPVNDAPLLEPRAVALQSVTEDDRDHLGDEVGTLIDALVTDVDSAAIGIALVSADGATAGVWQYSIDGGSTWVNVGGVSDAEALLLRPSDRLRVLPDGANGGTADALFRAWDGSTGVAGTKIDVGGGNAWSLTVGTLTADITDVADRPTLRAATLRVDENSPGGTIIGRVIADDVDRGDVVRFDIADDASGMFVIDQSGVVRVADGAVLDAEAVSMVQVTVVATDAAGLMDTRTYSVAIADVNEAPIIAQQELVFVRVGDGFDAPFVRASDPDRNDTFAFSISGGESAARFVIDPATGRLGFAGGEVPPIEDGPHTIEIAVADGAGAVSTATITITVEGGAIVPPERVTPPIAPPTETNDDDKDDSEPSIGEPPEVDDAVEEEPTAELDIVEPDLAPLTEPDTSDGGQRIIPVADDEQSNGANTNGDATGVPSDPGPTGSNIDASSTAAAGETQSAANAGVEQRAETSAPDGGVASPIVTITMAERAPELVHFLTTANDLTVEITEVLETEAQVESAVFGTASAVSVAASFGYVLWAVRGGSLIASIMTAVPLWSMLDPLPVLDHQGRRSLKPPSPDNTEDDAEERVVRLMG